MTTEGTEEGTGTTGQLRPLTEKDRFGRLIERRDGADFPYYNGVPVELSVGKWILVWASVAVGFLALILIPQPNDFVALLPRALFVIIPLAVLALVAGRHWSAIFRRVRWVDVGNMFFFAALNIVLTFAIGGLVSLFFPVAPNATIADAGAGGVADTIALYVGSGIQLIGEEIFVVLPFLALMYFLFAKAGRLAQDRDHPRVDHLRGVVRCRAPAHLRLELGAGDHHHRLRPHRAHPRVHPHQEPLGLGGRAHHQRLGVHHGRGGRGRGRGGGLTRQCR